MLNDHDGDGDDYDDDHDDDDDDNNGNVSVQVGQVRQPAPLPSDLHHPRPHRSLLCRLLALQVGVGMLPGCVFNVSLF